MDNQPSFSIGRRRMHEMSIAHELVEAVAAAARDDGAVRVTRVTVRVGAISGVAPDALAFAYDVAAAGTLLEGSELAIDRVPLRLRCLTCGISTPPDERVLCPLCGDPADIIAGRELEVASMVIEDAEEPAR